jgi:membrane protease YdiL (CAAX protease family)
MSIVRKIAAFGAATVISAAIVAYGQGLWQPLVIANLRHLPDVPWSAAAMAALIALLILYLGGYGPPRSTSARRRELLRWNPIPLRTFGLAIGVGVLALVALCGLWITVSDLVHIPAGIQPKMHGVPTFTLVTLLVMSAIAAPVTEEAAFRGYAMGILQDSWKSTPAAIIGSTLLFAAAHVLQGPDPAKLGLYFAAGLIFATIAYLTNSLYAVMVVHGIGDILGFTLLWPHDARPHGMGLADPLFAPAVAALVVFTPLALLGFRKLASTARSSGANARSGLGATSEPYSLGSDFA